MPTDVPLLNDYKKSFVRKRLLQTFLAGLRLLNCPFYSFVVQLVIFLLPCTFATPLIYFTIENNDQHLYYTLAFGSAVFFQSLILQTIGICLRKRAAINAISNLQLENESTEDYDEVTGRTRGTRRRQFQPLVDEDDSYREGFWSSSTWSFIIPGKHHHLNVFLHSIVAGVVASSGFVCLQPDNVQYIYPRTDPGVYWTIIGFGWFSVLQSIHAVVLGCTPETATFRALDTYEISAMSRPLHVFLITSCPFVLELTKPPYEDDRQLYSQMLFVQQSCYVFLASLPALWFLGWLPPVEPLIFWLLEQIQVFCFGGTPAANNCRCIFYIIISTLSFVIIYFASASIESVMVLSGILGYILSLDLWTFVKNIQPKLKSVDPGLSSRAASHMSRISSHSILLRSKTASKSLNIFQLPRRFAVLKELLMHVLFFSLNIVVISAIPVNFDKQIQVHTLENTTNKSVVYQIPQRQLSNTNVVLGWITFSIYVLFKLTNELQKVYLVFGLFRSPLYTTMTSSDLTAIIWYHLRALIFNFMVCLYLVYYFKSLIIEDTSMRLNIGIANSKWKWMEVLAIARTLRWIWQNSESALIEFSFLHIMIIFAEPIFVGDNSTNVVAIYFDTLSRPLQVLLLSFFRDRAKQIIEKSYFVIALTVSVLEERASRRPYAGCLFQMNVMFAPIIFLMIVMSSIISAPILSIFTLPIFFVAYPRPMRFWPGSNAQASICNDSVYYEQLIPPLVTSIHQAIRAGKLGLQQAGNFLLARHEDRLAYVQVMEKGNGFMVYTAKGLELQETSCHSLEAVRLDDIFQDAFDRSASLNVFAFHTVTPMSSITIRTYSASKNSLTGIIEAPDTLKLVAKTFVQTLVWYTITVLKHKTESQSSETNERQKLKESETETYVANQGRGSVKGQSEGQAVRDHVPEVPTVSSLETENLSSWPTSNETTPDQARPAQSASWAISTQHRSTNYRRQSRDSIPSILNSISMESDNDESEARDPPAPRRGGLLPPIKSTPPEQCINLPGGILERTPKFNRKHSLGYSKPSASRDGSAVQHRFLCKSNLGKSMEPPRSWTMFGSQFNFEFDVLEQDYSTDWTKFCLRSILKKSKFPKDSDIARELESVVTDSPFLTVIKQIVFSCISVVYDHGGFNSMEEVALSKGPSLVASVFRDALPWTLQSDWLMSEALDLHHLVILPAFRCAVKLAIDQMTIGPFLTLSDTDDNIRDMYTNWHLSVEEDPSWREAVLREVPNLFSMSVEQNGRSAGRSLYRSHMLCLRDCQISVGRMNPEVVKGLWASLSLELLYLTNDDDERYSIQAEERLLRNLTVEVADPPLGYAIYSSRSITQGLEYF